MDRLPPIGLRIVKTGISVMLCLLLAHWLNRPAPIYACIAAVIVTRENVALSFKQGIARIISTIVGCFFALIIMHLELGNEYLHILIIGVGCALTIYFCVLIKHPDAAALSAITYLLLMLTHLDDKYVFTLTRLTETVIGIILAIGVNSLLRGNDRKGDDARPETPEDANIE